MSNPKKAVSSWFRAMSGFRLQARMYFLVSACLFWMACGGANAQISPGPLARAHRDLNGSSNCIKCHEFSTKSPSFRCLDCHREIAAELQQHRGLHSTFPQSGPTGAACVKCHSDHNGENFALLHWEPTAKGFDHAKTGFILDGKHASADCRACHTAQHISATERAQLTTKDLSRTWLGLSTGCVACHEDKHQGRFGANCTLCHSTAEWKGAKIDEQHFDHTKTRFPLTGMHLTTPCQKCHTTGDDGRPRFAGIKFATCAGCHADPHKGEFNQDCNFCHTTHTWKKSSFTATFDHSKTQFPLLGKHLEVNCVTCHKSENFKAPVAHAQCADCHKTDPHSGQFAQRADGGKCESCHTVKGWIPSTFTVDDHAKTKYPLVSPHDKVKCAQCHTPAGKQTIYKVKFARCLDCHKDEHTGQFSGAPWSNRCEQCHAGATFKSTTYTLALHQKSSWPLTGGHQAVACNECHKPLVGSKVAVFHFKQMVCTTCHEDIHKGEFAERMAMLSGNGKPMGCEACHTTKDWAELSKFDHAHTRFPLEGSHRAVACADCHKPPQMELNMLHVQFASAPTVCSECHENPHADQFGARGGDCAGCHTSNKWKPSLFDHEKTKFSLKGGHQNVACTACHTLKKPVEGKPVLFYQPTPTSCEACHGSSIPQTQISADR